MSALLALATSTLELAEFVVRLGTIFVAVALAVSVMFVPDGVLEFTWSTTVKLAVLAAPVARLLPSVQLIVPVPPTAGRVPQVHPAGIVIDWKFVFGGSVSENVVPVAAAGPLLVTVCV